MNDARAQVIARLMSDPRFDTVDDLDVLLGLAYDFGAASKTRAAAKPKAEPFEPATGNPELDAWMAASRERLGAPKAPRAATLPRFPYGIPKRLSISDRYAIANFNHAAITAWSRLGFEIEVKGKPAVDGHNVRVVGLVQ